MKTLFLATAALAIAGAGTVQAADIFTCGVLEYAAHDGRVELACAARVTTHWMKLGGHSSGLVYSINEPDGRHVAVTTQQGMKEKASVARFETVLPPGQSVAVSSPPAAGEAPARIVLSNAGGHLHIAEPAAWGFAQCPRTTRRRTTF
jgi:hypothetical protein